MQQAPPPAPPGLQLDDSAAHLRWSDPQYPFNPLDRATALQYFEFSPFYDGNSNNKIARINREDPSDEKVLSRLPLNNTEFALAQATEPHLFVVRKQQRVSANPVKIAVSQYYYILGCERYTYQAPSLHAVVNARLRRAMHHVRDGFNRFKDDLAPLPKVLREHVKEQEALQQQQLEMLAAMDAEDEQAAAAAAAGGAEAGKPGPSIGQQGGVAAAGSAAAAAAAAAAKPVPVRDVLSETEQEHWVKTDNIIMHVLRRYPQARLPKSKAEQEREKQLLEEQQRQKQQARQAAQEQQQQQQQQQEPGGAAPVDAAALAAQPVALQPAAAAASKQRGRSTSSAAAAAAGGAGGVTSSTGSKGTKRPRAATPPTAAAAAAAAHWVGGTNSQGSAGMPVHSYDHSTGAAAAAAAPRMYGSQEAAVQRPPAAAAAPAPSASMGGMSMSMGGGTAATAASAGGTKMKLKFKLNKKLPGQAAAAQPGAGEQQQRQGSQEPAAKRPKQ